MDETERRALVKKRGVIKSRIKRMESFLSTFDETGNINDVKVRQKLLENSIDQYNEAQNQLEINDDDPSHDADREIFEDLCLQIQSKIETILSGTSISPASLECPSGSTTQAIKLPTISLPKFTGSLKEFMHFHDTFKALIIQNDALTDIQRYYYLLSCLSGEPHHLIENLPITQDNFKVAWNLICNRYHNPKLILDIHVTELLSLPTIKSESAKELRLLINQLCSNLNAIEALNISTPLHEVILSHMVLQRISLALRKQWENKTSSGTCPSLADLVQFLESNCQTLEIVSTDKSGDKGGTNKFYPAPKGPIRSFPSVSLSCGLCDDSHTLHQCLKFRKMHVSDRISFVKKHELCFNCLKGDHRAKSCTSGDCRLCKRRHHTLLHCEQECDSSRDQSPQQIYCSLKGMFQQHEVLLSTAIVHIQDNSGRVYNCRALLDSGSQINFMSRELANRLGLRLNRHSMPIKGISNTQTVESSHICQVRISSKVSDYSSSIVCSVLPQITGQLPSSRINCNDWQLPQDITFADPHFHQPREIDLLLGAAVFYDILLPEQRVKKDHPILQNTTLGWVLAGCIPSRSLEKRSTQRTSLFVTQDPLHAQVERFWEQEEVRTRPRSKEEVLCEEHFNQFTTRDESGRFIVKLPLRSHRRQLGESLKTAKNRFGYTERKLDRQPSLKSEYVKFMQEYEDLGHMEKLDSSNEHQITYYLPHHAVVKEDSTTTRVRVVFDASAKTSSALSLNDIMMVGPTVQQELFSIVLRFRTHRYVLTADIEKMYRQILVHSDDRDLQRIVWRSSPHEPLETYRLTTVTYGTAAAPFLATRCLMELANTGDGMYQHAVDVIKNDFYVDDLLTGTNSIQDALRLQEELTSLLRSGGFTLRKWRSNNLDLLASIPAELREDSRPCKINFGEDAIRTLGVLWQPADDTLKFEVTVTQCKSQRWTKRSILAKVASIFDPLGLLGPVIIRCKLVIQSLWQKHVDWDDPLPADLENSWNLTHKELTTLNNISIPRRVTTLGNCDYVELHGFSDASERAYGACIYLRCTSIEEVSVFLLTSKSRVAPLKQVSLPRLELCGALLLARLMEKVSASLNMKIHARYYWTDSTIVLAWITGCPTVWKTYVANRVSEIQDLSNVRDWRHVASQDNPADLISRGLEPQELGATRLWWAGPTWLPDNPQKWPKMSSIKPTQIPEERKPAVCFLATSSDADEYLQRFSSWSRLHRVTAYILRFFHNLQRRKSERLYGTLTTAELNKSLETIVCIVQRVSFKSEIHELQQNKTVPSDSKLLTLCPFLDRNNLVRVGGRLENASTSYDQKHPLILPPKHHVTKLLILHEHQRLLHAGSQLLLASLRQRFWFSNGRSIVRHVIRRCLTCYRVRASTMNQIMGQLPTTRVNPSKPFSNCGVDYGGPLLVRHGKPRSRTSTKCYIALFVCMATKAIHLELVSDMSTEAFIAALRRFIARRGRCNNIYSDNGTCFVGAMNKLKELQRLLKSPNHQSAVKQFTSKEGIEWHFIPPHTPHFGGLWEAGIKSVKTHLRRVAGNTVLTFEELYTLLTQVEACLNSRPITPLPNSSDEFSFLTPGHFLVGEPLISIPEPDCTTSSSSHISRWQLVQRCRQQIWKRWSCDYLSQLQQRAKWHSPQPNAQPGTLVLIKEDNLSPLRWQTGIIEEVHPGADGLVRVVSVRTSKGTYKRSVTRICPFPSDS